MKTLIALAAALLVSLLTPPVWASPEASPQGAEAGRAVMALDTGWKFRKGEADEAQTVTFDDAPWQDVTLPHSFNGADGDDGGGYYRGPAWYRKTAHFKRPAAGRRVFLQFDGAALATKLWVNGLPIGSHEGGYATFRFDITGALRDGRNIIAVRVDNSHQKTIAPLGGDFTVFGGLYRRVFLIETGDAHVDLMDMGGPGVRVRTNEVKSGHASLDATVRIRNDAEKARRLAVRLLALDAEGRTVAESRRTVMVPARQTVPLAAKLDIPSPRLWQGREDPYLYKLRAIIEEGARQTDAVTVPFGIRTVGFDARRGFLLNGRPYPLRGVNLFHSGRPGRGLAVTDQEVRDDIDTFVEMGATSLRLVHFQHPQAAYDEADRRGILLWTEIPLNSAIDDSAAFAANAMQQLRELILQNAHHPSVVLWGLGNEVYSTEPAVAALLGSLNAEARALDPTRPSAYAHCCQSDDDPKARIADIPAFNRYFGWYPDQKGTIGDWASGFHAAHPETSFIVSEYGAGASIWHQEDPPGIHATDGPFHPEQAQTRYHEENWRMLREQPGLAGTYVWVGFDLASDGRSEGDRDGINDKGLVTYDRLVRKDAWHWYRANWSNQPVLYLTSRRFTERTSPVVEVKAYANRGAVTLVVNGRTIGSEAPVDHIVRWPGLRLEAGRNLVEVRMAGDDGPVTDSVEWFYSPKPGIMD